MDLLEADKGGLVFVPRAGRIMEDVAQIDFSQMYPSIMNIHNVSPETINCICCSDEETEHVPEIHFRICKRRRGIVSDALAHILKRRKYYKDRIKELKREIRYLEEIKHGESVSSASDGKKRNDQESTDKVSVAGHTSRKDNPSQSQAEDNISGAGVSGESSGISNLKDEMEIYDHRQSSLKWMLVTSFGYLGYRNAKFGKIESHEAVTAFGRDKLLTAKEIAEEWDYSVVHGITDCLFLKLPSDGISARSDTTDTTDTTDQSDQSDQSRGGRKSGEEDLERLERMCASIGKSTGIEMSVEGIYDWVIFLPSRSKPGVAVVNRYFGRFRDGSLRIRGISVRRKDRPVWIKHVQDSFLEKMALCTSARELKSIHPEMESMYYDFRRNLMQRSIPWTDLLLRRTVSKGLEDYAVDGPAPAALRELEPFGIQIQAGEKVKYIVLEKGQPKASKYMSEEIAFQSFGREPSQQPPYSISYYSQLLYDAFQEVWEYAAPEGYFQRKDLQQLDLPGC